MSCDDHVTFSPGSDDLELAEQKYEKAKVELEQTLAELTEI